MLLPNLALELGDHVEPVPAPHKEQLDFLDEYFAEQRQKRADSGRAAQ